MLRKTLSLIAFLLMLLGMAAVLMISLGGLITALIISLTRRVKFQTGTAQ